MVTYYRGPSALITHQIFEVRGPDQRRYAIADLYDVHIVLFSGAWWRLNPPEYQLCATYRGHEVELYRTRDPRTFGQVKRGLIRALEAIEAYDQH